MKRHHALILLLSLAVLGMCEPQAGAFFCCKERGYMKYSTYIACRPYNAFSPICSGSMEYSGCCPFPMGGGFNPMCCTPSMMSPLCHGMNCCPPPPCCPDPCASMYGPTMGYSGGPPVMMPPMPQGGYHHASYGVRPVGYYPPYYPQYYPPSNPSGYWYGGYGR